MPPIKTNAGYTLIGVGILGIIVSFIMQPSDFDPTGSAISLVSVFLAIVGIALVFEAAPANEKAARGVT
jgi:hypothetical membrane protein